MSSRGFTATSRKSSAAHTHLAGWDQPSRTEQAEDRSLLRRQTIAKGDKVSAGPTLPKSYGGGTVQTAHKDGTYTVSFTSRGGLVKVRTRDVTLDQKAEDFRRDISSAAPSRAGKTGTRAPSPATRAKALNADVTRAVTSPEDSQHFHRAYSALHEYLDSLTPAQRTKAEAAMNAAPRASTRAPRSKKQSS